MPCRGAERSVGVDHGPPRPCLAPLINTLAREVVAVARANGVHGRLRIQETKDGYAIVMLIPASETVMAHAR